MDSANELQNCDIIRFDPFPIHSSFNFSSFFFIFLHRCSWMVNTKKDQEKKPWCLKIVSANQIKEIVWRKAILLLLWSFVCVRIVRRFYFLPLQQTLSLCIFYTIFFFLTRKRNRTNFWKFTHTCVDCALNLLSIFHIQIIRMIIDHYWWLTWVQNKSEQIFTKHFDQMLIIIIVLVTRIGSDPTEEKKESGIQFRVNSQAEESIDWQNKWQRRKWKKGVKWIKFFSSSVSRNLN